MKLFEFTLGDKVTILPFRDNTEAFERRAEVDPTYDYMPVVIKELVIEGYTITVTASKAKKATE